MKYIFLISFLFFFGIKSYSQTKESISNELEEIFQKSFDSTIIFHTYSNWGDSGEYFFIGKKNDTIYYYRYFSPIKQLSNKHYGPKNSVIDGLYYYNKFYRYHKPFNNLNLNDKFYWIYSEKTKGSLWERIQNFNMWKMVDEEDEYLRKSAIGITDGGECLFKLITNKELVKLYYYSPWDYPIKESNKVRNQIKLVVEWIYDFYKNHKLELIKE